MGDNSRLKKTIVIALAVTASLILFPPLALLLAFLLLVRTLKAGSAQPVVAPVACGASVAEPAELAAGG